jgi:hypothetical protein
MWSHYASLKRIVDLKIPLQMMAALPQYKDRIWLHDETWIFLELIVQALQPFMVAQKVLEAQKKSTIGLVIPICGEIREQLAHSKRQAENELTKDGLCELRRNALKAVIKMLTSFIAKFEALFGDGSCNYQDNGRANEGFMRKPHGYTRYQCIGSLLDWRSKDLDYVLEHERNDIVSTTTAFALSVHMEGMSDSNFEASEHVQVEAGVGDIRGAGGGAGEPPVVFRKRKIAETHARPTREAYKEQVKASIQLEMNNYIQAQQINMYDVQDGKYVPTCTLVAWKTQEKRFPYLAAAAMRVLAIPATSAPSERVFSTAGLTNTKQRNRLKAENVELLVLLHNSWPSYDASMEELKQRRLEEEREARHHSK